MLDGPDFRRTVLDADGNIRQSAFDAVWRRLRVLARCSPADKFTIVKGAHAVTGWTQDLSGSRLATGAQASLHNDSGQQTVHIASVNCCAMRPWTGHKPATMDPVHSCATCSCCHTSMICMGYVMLIAMST